MEKFHVAVMGLEKAGKTTLINALLKSCMLPTYTERCTYAMTKVCAGEEDGAEVLFYSLEEFQLGFQQLLKIVGYSGNEDFSSLEYPVFKKFWDEMEDKNLELFMIHNHTTVADIRAMLEGKSTILEVLGNPPRNFALVENESLWPFITGIKKFKEDGTVEHTALPYAVKEVVIKSTQLQNMKNIVLYDVPGFDSPSALNKKQTEEMINITDAIILVTNVLDPYLSGSTLDMLRKFRNNDGIEISDKTFVFGNKLDMSHSKEIALKNEAVLRKECVCRYNIALDERVVVGSARAYMENTGLIPVPEGVDDTTKERLNKWGISDGIQTLQDKLQDYYNCNRTEILKRKTKKSIQECFDRYSKKTEKKSESLEEFGQKLKNGRSYKIDSLLDRFFSDLLLAVIAYPFGSEERYQYVTCFNKPMLMSISAYYRDDEVFDDIEKQRRLVSMVLFHDEQEDWKYGDVPLKEFLQKLYGKCRRPTLQNKEEIFSLLDKDIEVLRDVTLKSVVHAIDLEAVYTSAIVHDFVLIRKELLEKEYIDTWLSENARV